MLGLGGVLGLYPLGEVELGAPSVPGTFVPHLGAVSSADSADASLAAVDADAVDASNAADVPGGDALRLGAESGLSGDRVESEVTSE